MSADSYNFLSGLPLFRRKIEVYVLAVKFPDNSTVSADDQQLFAAALDQLFDVRSSGVTNLKTGHMYLGPNNIIACQDSLMPEVILSEITGRPVQRLLRHWFENSVGVDLLFVEPDATGTVAQYAWHFTGMLPTNSGSDVALTTAKFANPEAIYYQIGFTGTFVDDLDAAIALTPAAIAARDTVKMGRARANNSTPS